MEKVINLKKENLAMYFLSFLLGMTVVPMWLFVSYDEGYILKSAKNRETAKNERSIIQVQTVDTIVPPPTPLEALREIQFHNIKYPMIVWRQILLESEWFKCKDCSYSKYNNPFGFRLRKWVSKENPLGYIPFHDWRAAVVYYKQWQAAFYEENKHKSYYDFLEWIGYAEQHDYVKRLKSIELNEINN